MGRAKEAEWIKALNLSRPKEVAGSSLVSADDLDDFN